MFQKQQIDTTSPQRNKTIQETATVILHLGSTCSTKATTI